MTKLTEEFWEREMERCLSIAKTAERLTDVNLLSELQKYALCFLGGARITHSSYDPIYETVNITLEPASLAHDGEKWIVILKRDHPTLIREQSHKKKEKRCNQE